MYDAENTLFALAADFIHYTNRSVFLTGKAGTGKTTFLKYIRQSTIKQTAIVAPTGVAAINAGGVTIHSFFSCHFRRLYHQPGGMRLHKIHGQQGRERTPPLLTNTPCWAVLNLPPKGVRFYNNWNCW